MNLFISFVFIFVNVTARFIFDSIVFVCL